ncbi:unnamed protein product (macronuclear) [Paramecium tetraurelia]|uniref:Aminotransferase class I/classII large domain-containing protein n=1 Tax=Paramecium tetraurelia TaxID=5888 RepID=A0CRJ1_PARTE|nr:uncharacterized protein GSPATT00009723001 [Paramecium tetraurelia]CAK73408.1 unnamed protein product [Paramecium tetraurelia]|eukprot:XP_001440805.1 hypothetical protein (macronuclear) [Paramecium tetraurelia strain d4-2]
MRCFKVLRCITLWSKVPYGSLDPSVNLVAQYDADNYYQKVNLGVNTYRDNQGNPVLLESVQEALQIVREKNLDNEYPPIEGLQSFIQATIKLGYGEKYYERNGKYIAGCQVLSGTGAVRLGFELLNKFVSPGTQVFVPNPTKTLHSTIAQMAGLQSKEYRYFNPITRQVDFSGLFEDLQIVPNGSIVLFHACSHNPTGCDLDLDQWKQLLDLTKQKGILPFFDMTYQGFTSGDMDQDAQAIRMFTEAGVPIMLGQSFDKNMGLAGQRTGCLSIVCSNEREKEMVVSQLNLLARSLWSCPPVHGARIAETILNNPEIYQLWLNEVKQMALRLKNIRQSFTKALKDLGSPHDWSHLSKQFGMYSLTGFGQVQIKELMEKYHIYLLHNGGISIAGLNDANIKYVSMAFHEVTKNYRL